MLLRVWLLRNDIESLETYSLTCVITMTGIPTRGSDFLAKVLYCQ